MGQGPEARKTGTGLHVVGGGVARGQWRAESGGFLLSRHEGLHGGPRHMCRSQ